MTCLCKKERSPYWMTKYRDATGRIVMRSTKKTKRSDALRVAITWEDAAKQARSGELTQAASVKVLRELMEQSTGETLRVPSIKQTLEGYLDACKVTGAAKSTLARYCPIFNRLLKYLGPVRSKASVASLSVTEVENWRNAELESGVSGKTANMGIGILRAALNAAKRRGEILHNPCDAVMKVEEISDERLPFTDDEVIALLKIAEGSDWQGAILIAVWTGLRLADVAGLTWGNVDLEKGTVTVIPDKTDKLLTQPLAQELKEFFMTLSKGKSEDPILPSLHGRITGRNGGLSNEFGRLMQQAQIDVRKGREKKGKGRQTNTKSFHSLRHTFVSRLANADVSVDIRKALAGHNSDEVHARYVHLAFQKQVEGIDKLNAFGGWR